MRNGASEAWAKAQRIFCSPGLRQLGLDRRCHTELSRPGQRSQASGLSVSQAHADLWAPTGVTSHVTYSLLGPTSLWMPPALQKVPLKSSNALKGNEGVCSLVGMEQERLVPPGPAVGPSLWDWRLQREPP